MDLLIEDIFLSITENLKIKDIRNLSYVSKKLNIMCNKISKWNVEIRYHNDKVNITDNFYIVYGNPLNLIIESIDKSTIPNYQFMYMIVYPFSRIRRGMEIRLPDIKNNNIWNLIENKEFPIYKLNIDEFVVNNFRKSDIETFVKILDYINIGTKKIFLKKYGLSPEEFIKYLNEVNDIEYHTFTIDYIHEKYSVLRRNDLRYLLINGVQYDDKNFSETVLNRLKENNSVILFVPNTLSRRTRRRI